MEGLTEFIPVSSTGHLILVGEALKFVGEKEKAFEVFIQLGAILSVVVLYRAQFISLFRGLFPLTKWLHKETYLGLEPGLAGKAGIINLALTTLPALVAGAILHKKVKALFFPTSVALALIAGGVLFLVVEHFKGEKEGNAPLSPKICFIIGCFQALALWPGFSRSGATIIGALILGVNRRKAAEFSFIAAVPIIAAASLLDIVKIAPALNLDDIKVFTVGLVTSFVFGMFSIKLLIEVMKRYSLRPFGVYRIMLGAFVLLGT